MARSGRPAQAFPELGNQTLKHRRLVRLKLTLLLDWRSTLDATLNRFHGTGRVEWKQ
jgi:hypothetical protein